ncbi:MAG TPA: lipopolysaccharide biosynthesis protein [Candidatus Limnocylindrales bacterium]|nr:lipopolysaccharide biosynthesis protein [Candidatus Limnocylindrales bacterium]
MDTKLATLAENIGGTDAAAAEDLARDLRRDTARGALISIGGQAASLVLRTGSMIVLARLLTPTDFGLVGMATAATGFLTLLKDAGLGMATVQRSVITDAQASTLFWVNLALGGVLAAVCAALAPAFVVFYGAPSLFWITIILGSCFIFNGASAQHRAVLQRNMRFGVLAVIDIAAMVAGIGVAIGMAAAGQRYWALVEMTVGVQAVSAVGAWLATRWIPGWPKRKSGIRPMLMFGGTVTLSNLIVYVAYNTDKILLGRFWGAAALGIYGRAYTLSSVANDNVYSAIGSVAFPALSRLQDDPPRFRSYFLKGYSAFLSLVMPITFCCALFANDIILVLLGPKWHEAARVFRWLAPTIMAFGLTHPFSWVMLATGRAKRCVQTASAITPVVILGYALGLQWGPLGVAAGFSISMTLAALPVILWAKHGTLITAGDVFRAVARPLLAIVIGAAAVLLAAGLLDRIQPAFLRLVVETGILFGVHLLVLLFVMKQKAAYVGLLRETRLWPFRKAPAQAPTTV